MIKKEDRNFLINLYLAKGNDKKQSETLADIAIENIIHSVNLVPDVLPCEEYGKCINCDYIFCGIH